MPGASQPSQPEWRQPSADHPEQAAKPLHIRLIGPMQLWSQRVDPGPALLPRVRKTRAVLAILALAAPRAVARDTITGLLWSTREREQARASLRQSVHELQELAQRLGIDLLRTERHHLQLNRDHVWIDVHDRAPPHPDSVTPASRDGRFLEDLLGLDPAFDAWMRTEAARHEPHAASPEASPASPRPQPRRGIWLAVAPLRAQPGTPEEGLAVGLADDITNALARFRWINLIATGSIAALAQEPRGETERWRALGLDFLLEGAIQSAGGRLRITMRLLDMRVAGGAAIIWSARFDRPADDLLALQDEIAAETVAQLDPELLLHESRRASAGNVEDATAYDLMLRAIPAIYRLEEAEYRAAGDLLASAAERAPESGTVRAWWACWHAFLVGQGWAPDAAAAMRRAGELADRAVALDPGCARALSVAGYVRSFVLHNSIEDTIGLHERALAVNPNLPFAWAVSALALSYAGDHDGAIQRARQAKRLSPFDPHSFFFDNTLMVPLLMQHKFEDVVTIGRASIGLNPALSSTYKGVLSALGHLGRMADAQPMRARLLTLEPSFTLRQAAERSPLREVQDLHTYIEGLRRAGLPEG
jgi:adenylate cyclase